MRPPTKKALDAATSKASKSRSFGKNGNLGNGIYRSSELPVNPASYSSSHDGRGLLPQEAAPAVREVDDREYLELCRTASGQEVDLEYFEKNREDRLMLVEQSKWIAEQLESVGEKAFGPSNLCLVGACSGIVEELPDFRNIVFIPVVAARKRTPMLKQLEYFLERNPNDRMWVVTSKGRATVDGVRETVQWLHRRISKLNNEAFMKENSVSIVFRSTELGSIERDEAGKATFHIHSHLIVHLERKLPKSDWISLLSQVRAFWKYHFKDAERIHGAREACKYVVKPQELRKPNAGELKALHEALFNLNLVQPLGIFKEQRKQFQNSNKTLVRIKKGEESSLKPIHNWNLKGKRSEPEFRIKEEPVNWIISTLAPSPILGPKTEPVAVVLNYRGREIFNKKPLLKARNAALDAFLSNDPSPADSLPARREPLKRPVKVEEGPACGSNLPCTG